VDQIETIEKEPINGKHPKPKRSKTSEPQVKRRTLRSSICDSKKTEEDKSSDAEIKKESEVKEETEKETEPLESKPNKRKASEDVDEQRKSKKIALIGTIKNETEINEEQSKDVVTKGTADISKPTDLKKIKKNLGPKSKRKSTGDVEPDESETQDMSVGSSNENKIQEATLNFVQKKKHSKCGINMFSLLQGSLGKAQCGHCPQVGQYTAHLVDFNLEEKIVAMECTSCNWTTVRRIAITTKILE
jgi:hypothetical protein